MHPLPTPTRLPRWGPRRGLRCSSFKYWRYSQSSRLARGAPRPCRCDARLSPRAASSRRGRSRRSRICASCFFGATTEKTPQVLAQAGLGNLTTATASRDTEPSRDAQRPRDRPGAWPWPSRGGAHAGGRASTCPMPRCISRLLMDQLHGWLTGAARGASGRAELRARRSHRC